MKDFWICLECIPWFCRSTDEKMLPEMEARWHRSRRCRVVSPKAQGGMKYNQTPPVPVSCDLSCLSDYVPMSVPKIFSSRSTCVEVMGQLQLIRALMKSLTVVGEPSPKYKYWLKHCFTPMNVVIPTLCKDTVLRTYFSWVNFNILRCLFRYLADVKGNYVWRATPLSVSIASLRDRNT